MCIKHKKRLLGGVSICLLLLFLWKGGQVWGQQRAVFSADTEVEVKKIALTFDDGPHPTYTEQLRGAGRACHLFCDG